MTVYITCCRTATGSVLTQDWQPGIVTPAAQGQHNELLLVLSVILGKQWLIQQTEVC